MVSQTVVQSEKSSKPATLIPGSHCMIFTDMNIKFLCSNDSQFYISYTTWRTPDFYITAECINIIKDGIAMLVMSFY